MKRITLMVLFGLIVSLTAYSEGDESYRYTAENGIVYYDATVFDPSVSTLPIMSAGLVYFDAERIASDFFGDRNYETISYSDFMSVYGTDAGDKLTVSSDTNATQYVSYRTEFSRAITTCINLSQSNDATALDAGLSSETDMAFMSRADAAHACEEFASNLFGVSCQARAVYAIDKATYDREYERQAEYIESTIQEGGKMADDLRTHVDWESEDICYLVYLDQTCNGIPISSGIFTDMREDTTLEVCGADMYVLYSTEGIQYMEVSQLYSFEETNEAVDVIPFEGATAAFDEAQNYYLGSTEMRISRVALTYLPDAYLDGSMGEGARCLLEPVWLFTNVTTSVGENGEYLFSQSSEYAVYCRGERVSEPVY